MQECGGHDLVHCGNESDKTYHFHENNKYTMYSSFLFENGITYIEEHLVIPRIIQIGRNGCAF